MTDARQGLSGLLDTEAIRKDFPILDRTVHDGKKIVYLDSAATSQKPRQVLDALSEYYERHNANVHRGVYTIAEEATALYEGARDKVAAFINAPSRNEVIFTKNASESLNLVANMLGWADEPYRVDSDTEIVTTEMEHHSNIVPWQLLSQRTGAKLKWFGITDDGRLDLSNIDEIITEKTKIVSFTLVSNIMGTINPVEAIVRRAQQVGALVCIDASQAAPHMVLDVQALQADFVAFTGHKMVGPTGIGVLWGRQELLEDLPPFLGGGEMIETVSMHSSTYARLRTSSRRERPRSRRPSASARPWTTSRPSAWRTSTATSRPSPSTRCAGSGGPGPQDHRSGDGRGPRGDDLLHARRHPPPRRGAGARRAGHRRPGRPPLRTAGLPAVRNSCDDASVVLPVLHAGRGRRPGGRAGARAELFRLDGRGLTGEA